MPDLNLKLDGEHFRRRYLLYIIHLSHNIKDYFYVGQTGDTKVVTARPVFRRLSAHFEDRKSTQNQVYQYIAHDILKLPEDEGKKTAFTEETRQKVEEYLVESKITMYAYHLEPFIPQISHKEHSNTRRKTLRIEKLVIRLLRKNGRNVMNKKSTSEALYIDCPYPEILKQVAKDFKLTLN